MKTKDLFSTTAGILYFNDLKLDFLVIMGLVISFLGAFLFSYSKIVEIYELKGKEKKFDEEKLGFPQQNSEKENDFVVYVIDPQIKS